MSTWDPDELATIGGADEIQIAALRSDGSLRRYTTIWVARVGDQLYGRSYRGRGGAWFRAVQPRRRVGSAPAAYRSKYGRCASGYVDPMVGGSARATTLRVVPT